MPDFSLFWFLVGALAMYLLDRTVLVSRAVDRARARGR